MRGRPSVYTPEIGEEICDRIPRETIGAISASLGISADSIYLWAREDSKDRPGFFQAYARARLNQTEVLADELIAISDDSSSDYVVGEDGKSHVDSENINRSRLRVDTRKWLLSKLRPDKYGDRLVMAGDVNNPLTIQLTAAETIRRKRMERLKLEEPNGETDKS